MALSYIEIPEATVSSDRYELRLAAAWFDQADGTAEEDQLVRFELWDRETPVREEVGGPVVSTAMSCILSGRTSWKLGLPRMVLADLARALLHEFLAAPEREWEGIADRL